MLLLLIVTMIVCVEVVVVMVVDVVDRILMMLMVVMRSTLRLDHKLLHYQRLFADDNVMVKMMVMIAC